MPGPSRPAGFFLSLLVLLSQKAATELAKDFGRLADSLVS